MLALVLRLVVDDAVRDDVMLSVILGAPLGVSELLADDDEVSDADKLDVSLPDDVTDVDNVGEMLVDVLVPVLPDNVVDRVELALLVLLVVDDSVDDDVILLLILVVSLEVGPGEVLPDDDDVSEFDTLAVDVADADEIGVTV